MVSRDWYRFFLNLLNKANQGGGGGTGTVTSVNVSGGTTGLTTSGGPVTTSGTITLAGTLDVDNGGTGATTASGARANLSAAVLGTNNDITSMTGVTGGISSPDFIQFDTTATVTDATGRLYYDDEDQFQTLTFQMNGAAIQRVGEELYYRVKLSSAATKGQVLMFTGSQRRPDCRASHWVVARASQLHFRASARKRHHQRLGVCHHVRRSQAD